LYWISQPVGAERIDLIRRLTDFDRLLIARSLNGDPGRRIGGQDALRHHLDQHRVKAGQCSFGLIARALLKQPRAESNEIDGLKFMQLRFPAVRAHDRCAALVNGQRRRRDGIAPVAALMFAYVEPAVDSLLDCRDFGVARHGGVPSA
jgi:hypothetical protein